MVLLSWNAYAINYIGLYGNSSSFRTVCCGMYCETVLRENINGLTLEDLRTTGSNRLYDTEAYQIFL